MAINMIGAIAILISSLIADIVYAWIDPRISYK
jgi:ABC-type dipeptide/oligopeptide/nickel transport system permease component